MRIPTILFTVLAACTDDTTDSVVDSGIDDTGDSLLATCEGSENSKYTSIQEAIDHAEAGDDIIICDGVYSEYLNFNDKELNLLAETPNGVVFDGQGEQALMSFKNSSFVTMNDIVFQSGNSDTGGALFLDDSSVVLRKCNLTGNSASYGGAIALTNGSALSLDTSIFTDNQAGYGGAIYATNDSHVTDYSAIGSTFEFNEASVTGSLVYLDQSSSFTETGVGSMRYASNACSSGAAFGIGATSSVSINTAEISAGDDCDVALDLMAPGASAFLTPEASIEGFTTDVQANVSGYAFAEGSELFCSYEEGCITLN